MKVETKMLAGFRSGPSVARRDVLGMALWAPAPVAVTRERSHARIRDGVGRGLSGFSSLNAATFTG